MKILLITETLHAGGAETFVLRLARKLIELGDDCVILNLNPDIENRPLLDAYRDVRIERIRIPALRWVKRLDRLLGKTGIGFSLQAALTRLAFERRYLGDYEVFHSNLFKTDLLMARIKQRHPGIGWISTIHGDYIFYDGTARGEPGERIAGRRAKMALVRSQCDAWVYISDHQARLLIEGYGFAPERFRKIYNGYEPAVALPPRGERPAGAGLTFIMVARGIEEKGWEQLIQAFGRLKPGSRLILVGSGPFLDRIGQAHRDDPGIEFAGFHPNPPALIQTADVFVFPSVYPSELLPTVIIEALYCGVPAIATSVGEIPAMLTTPDGRICGQLIEPGPPDLIVDRLVAAMTRYIEDRAFLDDHRTLAVAALRKFDMTECAERYRALYREVATKP